MYIIIDIDLLIATFETICIAYLRIPQYQGGNQLTDDTKTKKKQNIVYSAEIKWRTNRQFKNHQHEIATV